MKKILITGGHTKIPIDQVRVISNIFKGKTACELAKYFSDYANVVLIGNPEMKIMLNNDKVAFIPYKTYDDLYELMKNQICHVDYDAIIHSAAVSDYYVSGVLDDNHVRIDTSKKVGSSYSKLYLELSQTRKIVDDIRELWKYSGKLVKFKLQVGLTDDELLEIASQSRKTSNADIIVANCLEWAKDRAYVIDDEHELCVARDDLPKALHERMGI